MEGIRGDRSNTKDGEGVNSMDRLQPWEDEKGEIDCDIDLNSKTGDVKITRAMHAGDVSGNTGHQPSVGCEANESAVLYTDCDAKNGDASCGNCDVNYGNTSSECGKGDISYTGCYVNKGITSPDGCKVNYDDAASPVNHSDDANTSITSSAHHDVSNSGSLPIGYDANNTDSLCTLSNDCHGNKSSSAFTGCGVICNETSPVLCDAIKGNTSLHLDCKKDDLLLGNHSVINDSGQSRHVVAKDNDQTAPSQQSNGDSCDKRTNFAADNLAFISPDTSHEDIATNASATETDPNSHPSLPPSENGLTNPSDSKGEFSMPPLCQKVDCTGCVNKPVSEAQHHDEILVSSRSSASLNGRKRQRRAFSLPTFFAKLRTGKRRSKDSVDSHQTGSFAEEEFFPETPLGRKGILTISSYHARSPDPSRNRQLSFKLPESLAHPSSKKRTSRSKKLNSLSSVSSGIGSGGSGLSGKPRKVLGRRLTFPIFFKTPNRTALDLDQLGSSETADGQNGGGRKTGGGSKRGRGAERPSSSKRASVASSAASGGLRKDGGGGGGGGWIRDRCGACWDAVIPDRLRAWMRREETIEGKEIRNTLSMGIAFQLVFTAHFAIQNLQSSLHEEESLGVSALSCLYAASILSSIFAPTIVGILGTKGCLVLAWLCHILYTMAQFRPLWATLVPASLILGMVTGPTWTAQGLYVTACAFSFSKRSSHSPYTILSRFNGLFFTLYETRQILGNLISSVVLRDGIGNVTEEVIFKYCGAKDCPDSENETEIGEPEEGVVQSLLGIYMALQFLGLVLTVFFVTPLSRSEWSARAPIRQTASSWFKTLVGTKMVLLVPLMTFQAMEQGILLSEYTKSYVSCPIGIHMVGFVMATHGATSALFVFLFSRVARVTGRFALFLLAAVIDLAMLVVLYDWTPAHGQPALVFLLPVIWGVGEGIWQTQTNSLIAVVFPGRKESAFANYQTWRAVGFTLVFSFHSALCVSVKIAITVAFLLVGIVLYTAFEMILRWKERVKVFEDSKAAKDAESGGGNSGPCPCGFSPFSLPAASSSASEKLSHQRGGVVGGVVGGDPRYSVTISFPPSLHGEDYDDDCPASCAAAAVAGGDASYTTHHASYSRGESVHVGRFSLRSSLGNGNDDDDDDDNDCDLDDDVFDQNVSGGGTYLSSVEEGDAFVGSTAAAFGAAAAAPGGARTCRPLTIRPGTTDPARRTLSEGDWRRYWGDEDDDDADDDDDDDDDDNIDDDYDGDYDDDYDVHRWRPRRRRRHTWNHFQDEGELQVVWTKDDVLVY